MCCYVKLSMLFYRFHANVLRVKEVLFMEERFVIKRKDFKKLERYAENIYNTAVVIDYFCSSQKEYEELYNLAPIVKNLCRDAE